MDTQIDIRSAVGQWTKDQLVMRASYYTGRNPNNGDLNSMMLELIY